MNGMETPTAWFGRVPRPMTIAWVIVSGAAIHPATSAAHYTPPHLLGFSLQYHQIIQTTPTTRLTSPQVTLPTTRKKQGLTSDCDPMEGCPIARKAGKGQDLQRQYHPGKPTFGNATFEGRIPKQK